MEEGDAGTRPARATGGMVTTQWRLRVDAKRCIGSGMCAGAAPNHFRLTGSVATPSRELTEPDQTVLDAAEQCPVEAITVLDSATNDPIEAAP
jgi:ferredoxin